MDTVFEVFEWIRTVLHWDQVMVIGSASRSFVIAVLTFVVLFVVFEVFVSIVLTRLRAFAARTPSTWDDVVVEILETVSARFIFFVALSFALRALSDAILVHHLASAMLTFAVCYQFVRVFDVAIAHYLENTKADPGSKAALHFLSGIFKVIFWVLGGLVVLENFGFNVTSVVAGLGIGGVAIALAAQNILGDLFGAMAIYFDKPFVVGDYIAIGNRKGTVERIGMKTTRIRSAEGEELVITNKEMTSLQIQNYGKMSARRIEFAIGVAYETTTEQLRSIPGIIRGIIDEQELTRVDRVHWRKFADSALVFEIVYFVDSSEFLKFADIQQEINLQIKSRFEELGIALAYPTQIVHLRQN